MSRSIAGSGVTRVSTTNRRGSRWLEKRASVCFGHFALDHAYILIRRGANFALLGAMVNEKLYISGGIATFRENYRDGWLYLCMLSCSPTHSN